ncbi:MAG: phosphate ABC transporter substrate-binding protein PstS [Acidobacteriaceae bacterium]|nr:phosphate ABC transporter substrate-binding protein PstS [Acidobacteriaceae bacterium]
MRAVLCVMAALTLTFVPAQAQTDALTGAGGTFPAPIYRKWIGSFEERNPGLPITYQAVGSEAGIQALERGEVDFAASDFPPGRGMQNEFAMRLIPTVVGAAVPAYNIPNLHRDLRFTPELLAKIYLGKVTRWNDPQIKALNHEARLPQENIVVIHRLDGSGTSYVWTEFLSQASVEWREKVGASITPQWPTGQAADGNNGVADLIARTPYSIGYVEFIYALQHRLDYGLVRNRAGNFVPADIDTLTAAASGAQPDSSGRISIVNPSGPNAYPIASFTWLLVPAKIAPAKRQRLASFLDWALSSGQREAAALGYVALPAEIAERARALAVRLLQ